MQQRAVSPSTALFVTTLSSFLSAFGASAVNVALPSIGRSLDADAVTLNWIVSAFLLTTTMLLIPLGRVADILGRKRIFIAGMGVVTLTGVAAALSTSAAQLIAIRAIQGAGGAMLFATATAIVVSVYPPSERGHRQTGHMATRVIAEQTQRPRLATSTADRR